MVRNYVRGTATGCRLCEKERILTDEEEEHDNEKASQSTIVSLLHAFLVLVLRQLFFTACYYVLRPYRYSYYYSALLEMLLHARKQG